MLVPLVRNARKPLAASVTRPISAFLSRSIMSSAIRRLTVVRAPALTSVATDTQNLQVTYHLSCGALRLFSYNTLSLSPSPYGF